MELSIESDAVLCIGWLDSPSSSPPLLRVLMSSRSSHASSSASSARPSQSRGHPIAVAMKQRPTAMMPGARALQQQLAAAAQAAPQSSQASSRTAATQIHQHVLTQPEELQVKDNMNCSALNAFTMVRHRPTGAAAHCSGVTRAHLPCLLVLRTAGQPFLSRLTRGAPRAP